MRLLMIFCRSLYFAGLMPCCAAAPLLRRFDSRLRRVAGFDAFAAFRFRHYYAADTFRFFDCALCRFMPAALRRAATLDVVAALRC